jgi:large subunit ribosomal protein L21
MNTDQDPGGRVSYAVVRTGGLQFRVAEGDTIRVPRMAADVGATVEIPDVLALMAGGELTVGRPRVEGATVTAEVVRHGRGRKVTIYKKKRRKGYQVKRGHRQGFTELRVVRLGA